MTAGTLDTPAADAKAKAAGEPAAAPNGAAAPVTPVVPEKYALTKPDGTLLSDKALERASEIAKALKLTRDEDAQAVLAFAHEQAAEVISTHEAARKPGGAFHAAVVKQYEDASLKHPQLGNGDARQLEAKALRAGLFLNQYATPEFTDLLKQSGLAAHPDFLLFANATLDRFSERPAPMPDSKTPAKPVESIESRMYGKKEPK